MWMKDDLMGERTEKQKMLADAPYLASDPELVRERMRARRLMRHFNQSSEEEPEQRRAVLRELLGAVGADAWIEPPFYCDYGSNIYVGGNVFMNFNCVLLDCNTIHIGDHTQLGPAVQIYTAYHPTDPTERLSGRELAAPVRIGRNVWIGGGAIICQGVSIGDHTTIGAGSVVTRDIPANAVAVGNPCRLIRHL
jgi:maltose O-acetyltransferase